MVLLTISCSSVVYAQKENGKTVDVASVTLLFPGVAYEKAIGNLSTLHAAAFLNVLTYSQSDYYGSNSTKFYFGPAAGLQYRYYCNYNRRKKLGKRTDKNTMNYVAALAQVDFSKTPIGSEGYENPTLRPVYSFGALYGLQRNYLGRFSLDLNFGIGVFVAKSKHYGITTDGTFKLFEENKTQATVPAQITLGFWL